MDFNHPLKNLTQKPLAVALASTLLLSGTFSIAVAKTHKGRIQNYLPPVASINGKLDGEVPEVKDAPAEDLLEPVSLAAVSPATLQTNPRVQKLEDKSGIRSQTQEFKTLLSMEQAQNEADLKTLWDATVEKNPVIRFSLEKLATPPDLHRPKSSLFLRKSLNLMLTGAAIGSTMLPGGGSAYRQMGVMAGGDAVRNVVTGQTKPMGEFLTATEQIQLAGLIDELQSKLFQGYHDYKNTLRLLAVAHHRTIDTNNLYSKALASKNELSALAAGSAYYKAMLNETKLRQKAIRYRLRLERLAGMDAVTELALGVDLEDTTLNANAISDELPDKRPMNPEDIPQDEEF